MESIKIREYNPADYDKVAALYKETELPGSEFDLNRDSEEKLKRRIENDPAGILVAEQGEKIVGSVSLIEDGRVAWLFRFRVMEIEGDEEIARALYDKAATILQEKGHHEILVYTVLGETKFHDRYKNLGFTQGHDYTCFWKNIS